MSRAIAIPYIIALVIGIIVLAFIVYWVYKLFSGTTIDCGNCKARFIQWCNLCYSVNLGVEDWENSGKPGSPLPLEIVECADKCGLHSKTDTSTDVKSIIKCADAGINPTTQPCITCVAPNVQQDCKRVGVG